MVILAMKVGGLNWLYKTFLKA